jgi:hypothetical protein
MSKKPTNSKEDWNEYDLYEPMPWDNFLRVVVFVLAFAVGFSKMFSGVNIKKSDELKRHVMYIKSVLDYNKIKLTRESILYFINRAELKYEQKNMLIDLLNYNYTEIVEILDNKGLLDYLLLINADDLVEYIKSLRSPTYKDGISQYAIGRDKAYELWVRGAKKRQSKKRKSKKRKSKKM